MTLEERFWSKVDQRGDDECWPWKGTHTYHGYGVFSVGQKHTTAHRIAYELSVGSIETDMEIDHLCRTRNCCNPAHLEQTTHGVNTLRGFSPPSINARKTHCIRGHELTEENIYRWKNRRFCIPCRALRQPAENAKKREQRRLDREARALTGEEANQGEPD